jgi:hypothetical protein
MWLTLTGADANVPVHVNLQLVTYSICGARLTELARNHHVSVKEKPEEIRAHVFSQASEPRPFSD